MHKKDFSMLKKLKSGQKHLILEGLQQFRELGNIEQLEEIIVLVNETRDNEIKDLAANLLFDVKKQDAVHILVNAIQNEAFIKTRKILALSCWQSGLDFSEYLPVFSELVRTADLETGLEAFTVVENFTEKTGIDIIKDEINATRTYLEKYPENNNILAGELLRVLEEMKKGKF